MKEEYDVAVVGGGVVGCAIARELTRYRLNVVLLEKEVDVGRGTSGKNSAVVHTGFNVPVGSLKARLNVEGAAMFEALCQDLDVPFKRVGKLVVALTSDEVPDLQKLKATGDANGVPSLEIVGADEIRRMEPNISGYAALHAPTAAIICPFRLTIALAENAVSNGADIVLGAEVKAISGRQGAFRIATSRGTVRAGMIVNSAGLYADHVARLAGIKRYKIYPCRGEYVIIDKSRSDLISRMVYPVPPKGGSGLGVHLTPTIDGNILIGPSAEYVRHKNDDATTRAVGRQLLKEAQQFLPSLSPRDIITAYAGIRPKILPSSVGGFGDFVIEEAPEVPGMLNLIGIESPGLTSAPAIAKDVANWAGGRVSLLPNAAFNSRREHPSPFFEASVEEQARLVDEDAGYGQIVCRCEMISRKEIVEAMHNPLGVQTLAAVKYRSRATMGRCQGGFCGPRIEEIMEEELGLEPGDVRQRGSDSWVFAGTTKGLRKA